jgi:hypothetical protein
VRRSIEQRGAINDRYGPAAMKLIWMAAAGIAVSACSPGGPVPPIHKAGIAATPGAPPGSGVNLPGSALSDIPATGHSGPMQGSVGMSVPFPQEPVVDQTGSQRMGEGPAQLQRGIPASVR